MVSELPSNLYNNLKDQKGSYIDNQKSLIWKKAQNSWTVEETQQGRLREVQRISG